MPNNLRITVAVGRLLWGYQEAAALHACALAYATPDGWTLSGVVSRINVYRFSQRPLTFEVRTASGVQRWPVVSLQEAGGTLTASLGPREKAHHGDPVCST